MKNRILLKEIPGGKFHSAIFTTYSINLYYLEQQVLPLLRSKGIHYVSILVDSGMLSAQLENYGFLSQQRKRNYAINGIQSNGAFHPKIIFLAGSDSILLLIGSGNLTTSGHGKNLEVWNSVYINSMDDVKYGFVIQAWNYLKLLHSDLGESANNKLKSIEENSFLLSNSIDTLESTVFDLDDQNQISFHTNQKFNSLFRQLSDIIGDDQIDQVTIMCPFHDPKGLFIREINNRYIPNHIDVLVQANFGSLPLDMAEQSNVNFYEWTDVMQEKPRQSYFHAKNIVFTGKNKNYLISGSANASLAAFGTLTIPARNQESCVIYQSDQVDYLELLSITLKSSPVKLKDYEYNSNFNHELSELERKAFIKSAEKNYDTVNLIFQVKSQLTNGVIQLFDTKGTVQYSEMISLESGDHFHQMSIPNGIILLFAQILYQGKECSNKQFITDINAFEGTNPSPRNRSLNQIRKLIESGNFSTPKIIDYLNTMYRQKEAKKGSSRSLHKEQDDELPNDEDDDIIYLSYGEIQERAKQIDNQEKVHHYIEYKGVRLWESIFSYLKEKREKKLQAKIDEEETEDIDSSGGRLEKKETKPKRSISISNFNRLKDKVTKFLDSYHEILRQKTINTINEKPSLIDLSMYLIMLEVLLHLIEHKESITEENTETHLIPIPLSKKGTSWSSYLIQYIGLFNLWCIQQNGFKYVDSIDYKSKLNLYKSMAFKTNLSALSIFNIVNSNYDRELQKQWLFLSLLNTNLVFGTANPNLLDAEECISFIPSNVLEEIGEEIIEDEISKNLREIKDLKIKVDSYTVGDFFFHPELGYMYIDKVIENPINTFYKLFTPGFEWDEEVNNYWNGQVYSIKEKKWLKSKRT